MRIVIGLTAFCIAFFLGACATSGVQQIQKKCKSVENMNDTYVCEQP